MVDNRHCSRGTRYLVLVIIGLHCQPTVNGTVNGWQCDHETLVVLVIICYCNVPLSTIHWASWQNPLSTIKEPFLNRKHWPFNHCLTRSSHRVSPWILLRILHHHKHHLCARHGLDETGDGQVPSSHRRLYQRPSRGHRCLTVVVPLLLGQPVRLSMVNYGGLG